MNGKSRRVRRQGRLHRRSSRRMYDGQTPRIANEPSPRQEQKAEPGKFRAFKVVDWQSYRIVPDVDTVAAARELCLAASTDPADDFQIFDDRGHFRVV